MNHMYMYMYLDPRDSHSKQCVCRQHQSSQSRAVSHKLHYRCSKNVNVTSVHTQLHTLHKHPIHVLYMHLLNFIVASYPGPSHKAAL